MPGKNFCDFSCLGSQACTATLKRSQKANTLIGKEIFAGTNFCDWAFDRENRENFCLAKISHYTVTMIVNPLILVTVRPQRFNTKNKILIQRFSPAS